MYCKLVGSIRYEGHDIHMYSTYVQLYKIWLVNVLYCFVAGRARETETRRGRKETEGKVTI